MPTIERTRNPLEELKRALKKLFLRASQRTAGTATSGGGSGIPGGPIRWEEQPVGPPPDGEDQELLVWIIQEIREQLRFFVYEGAFLMAPDVAPIFQQTWDEIESACATAVNQVPEAWAGQQERLKNAGLVGPMLKMKARLLRHRVSMFSQARPQFGEVPFSAPYWQERYRTPIERMVGAAKPLFGTMNSLLGSLSGIFPVLEGVKEYKEHVENSVEAMRMSRASD
jgi:hypothetical protein